MVWSLPVAVGVQHVVSELAFERVGQLVQPEQPVADGLNEHGPSAARMTVISEQVDATVDRFIGIHPLFPAVKAALSFLTKRLHVFYI